MATCAGKRMLTGQITTVAAAAEAYFGKDVEHVTIAEAAMLAGLPKAPTKFSPYNDFERARERA